jgi:hypothetical protein
MKKLVVLASAILLTVSACKKDDKTAPITATPKTTENTEFSLVVDGTKIVVDSSVAIIDTTTTPYDRVDIEAYSNGVRVLYLTAWARVAADSIDGEQINVQYTENAKNYNATTGNLNVTTLDLVTGTIAGTFDFEATEIMYAYVVKRVKAEASATKTITDGHLYITNVQIAPVEYTAGPMKENVK